MELNFCVFHLQQSTICLEMNLRISTVVVELFVSYVNFFLRLTKSSHFIFSSFSSSFWFPLFLTKSEWLYEYVLEKLEENRQLPMDFQSFMVKNRNWHWHMWFVCWSAPHTHKHAHLGCFVKMRLFYLLVNTFRLCICMHTNESSLFTCFLLLPFISSHYYIYVCYASSLSYFAFVFKMSKHAEIEQFVGILNGFVFGYSHTLTQMHHITVCTC